MDLRGVVGDSTSATDGTSSNGRGVAALEAWVLSGSVIDASEPFNPVYASDRAARPWPYHRG